MQKIIKILILVAVVIVGGIGGYLFFKNDNNAFLSADVASQKAISFINENLVEEGTVVSLISVLEESGLYKIKIKLGDSEIDSYITKDAKFLFPQEGIDMSEDLSEEEEVAGTQESQLKTCEDIEKSDKPLLEAFIVSKCPFGLQMQRVLSEIVKNIPSLAGDVRVEYIGSAQGDKITSMHGDEEAEENLRQICLRDEQSNKYWKYVDCHIKKGDVESCLTEIGADINELDGCMNDNSRGLEYAKQDFVLQDEYKVTGSPTLFLDSEKISEFDFGGRTAEAVKTLLCCGFNVQPDFCSQELTAESAASSFSETYSESSGSSDGSCE